VWQRVLGHEKAAFEAGIHLHVELFLAAADRIVRNVDACVVEQHVQAAESRDGFLDGALAVFGQSHIRRNE